MHPANIPSDDQTRTLLHMKDLLAALGANYHIRHTDTGIRIYMDEIDGDGKPKETYLGETVIAAVNHLTAIHDREIRRAKSAAERRA